MSTPRAAWAGAGIIAGLAGLAVSHAAAMVLTLRSSPIVSVAETIIEVVPGTLIAGAIDNLGTNDKPILVIGIRSEEHTSELQSLMRISYAVFCLKKKKQN